MTQRQEIENKSGARGKVIEEAMRVIQKQFGAGAITRLGGQEVAQVEVIPTGSLALDTALGIGGF
ncbi:MAG TPA: DNA recombination/repair protein RecA, partial [Haliangium sp.]|nr:DNA recombination/repair protein RecA [Haliangium sp.]